MITRSMLMKNDEMLNNRYALRLSLHGRSPRTLGWDTQEHQRTRFSLAAPECQGKTVLDIGCGLGDFCGHLAGWGASYTGYDINPEFIALCREDYPRGEFEVRNILLDSPQRQWDVVVLFGLLNLKFQKISNMEYARSMIRTAFALARDVLIFDMLSDCADPGYPREDFVQYYSPAWALEFALMVTPHVTLRHDYPSIPQREFTVYMRRQPC